MLKLPQSKVFKSMVYQFLMIPMFSRLISTSTYIFLKKVYQKKKKFLKKNYVYIIFNCLNKNVNLFIYFKFFEAKNIKS
jgi:hypothetical protein